MYLGDSNITNLDLDNIRVISKTDNILFSYRTNANFSDGYRIFRVFLTVLSMRPFGWRSPKQIRADLITVRADNIILM